jgi:nitrogen regulatory protein PII-like uncharacterized protein
MSMNDWKSLSSEEKAQTSLEYLYLTAFTVGIVTIVALLINDVIAIQDRAKNKVASYRTEIFRITLAD